MSSSSAGASNRDPRANQHAAVCNLNLIRLNQSSSSFICLATSHGAGRDPSWASAYQYITRRKAASLPLFPLPSPICVKRIPHYPMSSPSNIASTSSNVASTSSIVASTSSNVASTSSNTAPTSSNFDTLFNAALAEYTKQTGKDLRKHPLASEIDNCDGPDSILHIFEVQAERFDEFKKGDKKLFNRLGPIIKVLHAFSTNEVLKGAISHVRPGTFLVTYLELSIHPPGVSSVKDGFVSYRDPSIGPHPLFSLPYLLLTYGTARRPSVWKQITLP